MFLAIVIAGGCARSVANHECTDGIDNDNDGAFDMEDLGCSEHGVAESPDPVIPQCKDGLDNDDDGMIERTYGRQARAPFNLTGSPAIAVPTGYSSSGMPLSMQIVGKPFREAMIYRVAHAYERATEWTKRRPALAERKAA